jgi:5-methylcytosine-specific restriction enzyme A
MPDAARRNPDWEWDETVLACDLVAQNNWQPLAPDDQRVVELSRLLQRMSLHSPEARLESFRNEDGVSRKTHNLASSSPTWTKWRSNGSQRDRDVVAEFQETPDVMHRIAQDLRQDVLNDTPGDYSSHTSYDDGSVLEGRYLLRFHIERERNRGLRRRKIRSVMARSGSLACEVCDLDFGQFYGDRGQGYIECHHVEPLHATGERPTRVNDLALLCSNCHRMIHRKPPWPTPSELRAVIEEQKSHRKRLILIVPATRL